MSEFDCNQSIESFELKKSKPTINRYIFLAILFLVCSVALGWLIGDMAVHMRTGNELADCHRGSLEYKRYSCGWL